MTIAEKDVEYAQIRQIIHSLPNLNSLGLHKMCGLAEGDKQRLQWACQERKIELKVVLFFGVA